MTKLRRRMDEAMIVRGMADRTRETYLWAVTGLARFYHRPPDQITDAEVQPPAPDSGSPAVVEHLQHRGARLAVLLSHDAAGRPDDVLRALAATTGPAARHSESDRRQTLDWLNQHTDGNIDFYAVIVEIVQIDDSRPACSFKLVVFPNEYRKSGGTTSERREAYRAFFQDLLDQLRDNHHFTGARVGQPQNWYSFASGISGITYGFSFALKEQVRTEIYIGLGDAVRNKALFDVLSASCETIEREFGEPLKWERLDDKLASRIAVYRQGSIESDTQSLQEIKTWAVDHLLRFKKIFGPKLTALVK